MRRLLSRVYLQAFSFAVAALALVVVPMDGSGPWAM